VKQLTQGFTDGYLHWEQQLNGRMGLQVTPMSVEQDSVAYLWNQFNTTAAPPVHNVWNSVMPMGSPD
jgi:hypothetical protein